MTESVQKSLPQTAPLNKEEKTEVDYEQMTVTELKDLCKERGLSNYTSLRKSELIDLLK
ncbi:MAG: Rho termination factor N-terminal domain-containing protein [Bacilli bacterium]|nr:Rho termination factor N-terminal domain-containing protein [Bacilli bacterium]